MNLTLAGTRSALDRREGRLRSLQRVLLVVCSLGVLGAAALHLGYLALGGR
ncbi:MULTISPECIES: hypothetical protein [Pseudomonas]|uniref:hypothetical protein n=1 Tax=Pseudomonas TaxID=286 RepID=UPI0015A73543|nr:MULTISPECIES: hypothetical protein [Pseudomonas]MDT3722014.1 hypothetical protein [Pseudomonas oryzihabitans]